MATYDIMNSSVINYAPKVYNFHADLQLPHCLLYVNYSMQNIYQIPKRKITLYWVPGLQYDEELYFSC